MLLYACCRARNPLAVVRLLSCAKPTCCCTIAVVREKTASVRQQGVRGAVSDAVPCLTPGVICDLPFNVVDRLIEDGDMLAHLSAIRQSPGRGFSGVARATAPLPHPPTVSGGFVPHTVECRWRCADRKRNRHLPVDPVQQVAERPERPEIERFRRVNAVDVARLGPPRNRHFHGRLPEVRNEQRRAGIERVRAGKPLFAIREPVAVWIRLRVSPAVLQEVPALPCVGKPVSVAVFAVDLLHHGELHRICDHRLPRLPLREDADMSRRALREPPGPDGVPRRGLPRHVDEVGLHAPVMDDFNGDGRAARAVAVPEERDDVRRV